MKSVKMSKPVIVPVIATLTEYPEGSRHLTGVHSVLNFRDTKRYLTSITANMRAYYERGGHHKQPSNNRDAHDHFEIELDLQHALYELLVESQERELDEEDCCPDEGDKGVNVWNREDQAIELVRR